MVRVATRHDCTVVMVGDCKVGKTALVNKFRTGKFESSYKSTSFESVVTSSVVSGQRIKYSILDTSGAHSPNSERALAYREADVFLLCYKITEPTTLFSAVNFWVPALRRHAPQTPIVMVGCQVDLRTDRTALQALSKQGKNPVSPDQAKSFAAQIEAVQYVELSSKISNKGPEGVFEIAALTSLEQVKERLAKPFATSTPEHTLDRDVSYNSENFWEQFQSPPLPRSVTSFHRTASLSSSLNSGSLNSTRSSISINTTSSGSSSCKNNLNSSFNKSRRNSMSLRRTPQADKMIKITCQRLNSDKIYEDIEIEVPAPIYETMQASNGEGRDSKKNGLGGLGNKLKKFFIKN